MNGKIKRVLMCVSYDGTAYSGFQVQENARTIEGELNKALSDLFGNKITVIGASRTDAGVHGLCNMVVFDTSARMPAEKVSFAINIRLPEDIRVVWSKEVPADFHPRHTDTRKTYYYRIFDSEFMPPVKRLYYYHVKKPLDIALMNKASKYLVGEHDFKSFCSVNSSAISTIRTLYQVEVERNGEEVTIKVTGNGFLYNMVRIIVGTLIEVGYGRRTPESVYDILNGCDRRLAGPTAPAHGLELHKFVFEDLNL